MIADFYFRHLLAELVEEWDKVKGLDDLQDLSDIVERARPALTASEQGASPQCVADGCLEEAARQEPGSPMQQLLSEAGGLLARWGRPAARPEQGATEADLFLKIDALLDGMDRVDSDPKGGWWATGDGAKFGRIKLRELKELIAEHQQGSVSVEPLPQEGADG